MHISWQYYSKRWISGQRFSSFLSYVFQENIFKICEILDNNFSTECWKCDFYTIIVSKNSCFFFTKIFFISVNLWTSFFLTCIFYEFFFFQICEFLDKIFLFYKLGFFMKIFFICKFVDNIFSNLYLMFLMNVYLNSEVFIQLLSTVILSTKKETQQLPGLPALVRILPI